MNESRAHRPITAQSDVPSPMARPDAGAAATLTPVWFKIG
jgi:hypothetical protein